MLWFSCAKQVEVWSVNNEYCGHEQLPKGESTCYERKIYLEADEVFMDYTVFFGENRRT
ncbi:MAG: hypothetical protein Ct9H300mP13_0180 [Gammaproteobacteria bacterium]|nr:MAG: hypothetical protein Ct9H300mP13_0180 [Gammaproteobacteria bacterium]